MPCNGIYKVERLVRIEQLGIIGSIVVRSDMRRIGCFQQDLVCADGADYLRHETSGFFGVAAGSIAGPLEPHVAARAGFSKQRDPGRLGDAPLTVTGAQVIDDDPHIARDLAQYPQIGLGFFRVNVQMLVRLQALIKRLPLLITEVERRNGFRPCIVQNDAGANYLWVR